MKKPAQMNQCWQSQWSLIPESVRLENLVPVLVRDRIRIVVESTSGLFHGERVMHAGLEKQPRVKLSVRPTFRGEYFAKYYFFLSKAIFRRTQQQLSTKFSHYPPKNGPRRWTAEQKTTANKTIVHRLKSF